MPHFQRGINLLDGSVYWTPQRRDLVQWFDDRAPSFAEGYVGVVRLLHMPSFPGRVHLISHIVRDIYRFLPVVLGMESVSRAQEVYPKMVEVLTENWEKYPPKETVDLNADSEVPVKTRVFKCAADLVSRCKELRGQPNIGQRLAKALFRALERREDEFIQPWIIKAFQDEFTFFIRRAHLAQRLDLVPNDDGLIEHFESFERAFHSLVGPYFTGKDELDEILQATNAASD